jgi:phosphatidate cytidylyltransferase
MLIAGTAFYEYLSMNLTGNSLRSRLTIVLLGVSCILFVGFYIPANNSPGSRIFDLFIAIATTGIFAVLISKLALFRRKIIFQQTPFVIVIGIVYICIYLSFLVSVRNGPDGIQWIFFILLVLWMGDTGAYIVGSMVGRIKLYPAVSPNKTIEGALAGLLFSVVAGLACKKIFLPPISMTHCILLTAGIALFGQLGDLCESVFKREKGFKDSGTILPGHGGILDRIDSLLFAAPFLYYYKTFFLQ